MAKKQNKGQTKPRPVSLDVVMQPAVTVPDKGLLAIFLVAKLLIVSTLLLVFYYFDGLHQINLWNRWYSGQTMLDAFYVPFSNWDAQHYLLLADRGYENHPHSHAFFPLYPALIAVVNVILKNIYVSAFALNVICSYLFCHVFYQYASHFLPVRTAYHALIFLLCYPTAFYLTVLYSEALFLFLLFGFLYFYDVKKSYVSLAFALLLPLTRAQTVFVVVALMIVLVLRRFRHKSIDYQYEVCNLAAFTAGGLLYLGFFQVVVGDAFSGIKAQSTFVFGNSLANILNPGHFLGYLFSEVKGLFSYTHSLVDKSFVIATLLCIGIVAKTKKPLWLALYIMLIYPVAAMGAGGSFSRLSLIAAPILALAVWTVYPRHVKIMYAVGSLFLVVQLYCAGRFALNLWVG